MEVMTGDTEMASLRARGVQILDITCRSSIEQAAASTSEADIASSQARFLSECQPEFPIISKMLVQKTQSLMDHAARLTAEVEVDAETSVWTTAGIIAAGLATFMLLGVYGARRWLANPVRDLSATMGRLANGDFSARIANADRRDEIGEMARAVEVFKSNGQRAIMLEQEAESVRGRGEAERARNAEIEKQRAAEMDQATRSLGKGLMHLAKGDLSFTLAEKFAPDFEGLREDFNAAVAQLASILVAVAAATSLIDAGSQEISRSADDLSRRTEQQAASLEETAALLNEITVNVTNASKRTEDARKIAHEAKEGAHRSSEVVTRAVDAIEKIEGSSRQISSIIGVIDEIAVQTNLLALNAGVEAARAGEAGEGFAVVAQEVRELAQRSAQAAKEIKGLIQASEAQVVNGAALVRETGEVFRLSRDSSPRSTSRWTPS